MVPFSKMYEDTIAALSLEWLFLPGPLWTGSGQRPDTPALPAKRPVSRPFSAALPRYRAQSALCKWFPIRKESPARVNSPEAWRLPGSPSSRTGRLAQRKKEARLLRGVSGRHRPAPSQLESDPWEPIPIIQTSRAAHTCWVHPSWELALFTTLIWAESGCVFPVVGQWVCMHADVVL